MPVSCIKGQGTALRLLKRSLKSGRVGSSYLFWGPEGVGRSTAAKEFARAMNCYEKKGDSCGRCASCRKIAQGIHPDVEWIVPSGKAEKIKIEDIRRAQRFLFMKPYEGRVKFCIVKNAHALGKEAGNALLKTLEEPPASSVLILITHMPSLLLPTVRSRMQDIQFFPLRQDIVGDILRDEMGFSPEDALLYSRMGGGSVKDALLMADEKISKARRDILEILTKGAFEGVKELTDTAEYINNTAITAAQEQPENTPDAGGTKKRIEYILGFMLSWYRDILVHKNAHNKDMLVNKDYADRIAHWEERTDTKALSARIYALEEARDLLRRQMNPKAVLQALFIKLELI